MFRNSQDYVESIVDEIALEGLDGITLEALWKRLNLRPKFEIKLDNASKNFIWEIIKKLNCVECYELESAREELLVPPQNQDITRNYPLEVAQNHEQLYPFKQINEGVIRGSCFTYSTRINISEKVANKSRNEVEETWGNKLVIVASQEARNHALFGESTNSNIELRDYHYPLIERIGRARYNGELLRKNLGLLTIINDNKRLFQAMKPILKCDIVKKQLFRESSSRVSTTLFNLTRFYVQNLKRKQHLIIKCVKILKGQKSCAMEKRKFSDYLDENDISYLNKKYKTPEFKKYFESKEIPDPMFVRTPKHKTVKKTTLLILKQPEIVVDNMFSKDAETNPEDEERNQPIDRKYYIDMLFHNRVFKTVECAGYSGISIFGISDQLGINFKTITKVLDILHKSEHLTSYIKDKGQVRTKMYVASKFKEELSQYQRNELNKMQASGETNVKTENESMPKEDLQLLVTNQTLTKIKRINTLKEIIKKEEIITFTRLLKIVCNKEDQDGHKYKIDRVTLKILIDTIAKEGLLRVVTGVYCSEDKQVPCILVLAAGVGNDDPRIAREVERNILTTTSTDFKIQDTSLTNERIIINQSMLNSSDTLKKLTQGDSNTPEVKIKVTNSNKVPHFIKQQLMHELMFYITRGYRDFDLPQDVLLERLYESGDVDDVNMPIPQLYTDSVSWKMFINPLPEVADMPKGWCMMADILLRMPLSIFNNVISEKYECEELDSYLNDKIRKHYLLKQLPSYLHKILFSSKNKTTIAYIIKRLCYLGLVQWGHGLSNLVDKTFLYVNLKTSLYDTISSEPGYYYVEAKEYKKLEYQFDSLDEVTGYWTDLFNICTNTKLGFRNAVEGAAGTPSTITDLSKPEMRQCLRPVSTEEAEIYDNGEIPGDKLGAAGSDSALFAYSKKKWVFPKILDHKKTAKKPPPAVVVSKKSYPRPRMRRKLQIKKEKAIKRPKIDDKDQLALAKLATSRSMWSRMEDHLILLCQSVKKLLGSKDVISHKEFRNVLQSYLEQSLDKTKTSVQRRVKSLLKNSSTRNTVENCADDLRSMPDVCEMLQNAAKFDPNDKRLIDVFYQIVKLVKERFFDSVDGLLMVPDVIIPDSLQELYDKFELEERVQPSYDLTYVLVHVIRDVILSSISCSGDKTSQAVQLFKIYRQYEQSILRSAVTMLRTQQILAVKKMAQQSFRQYEALPLSSSLYNLSQRFHYLFFLKYKQKIYHSTFLEYDKLLKSGTNSLELDSNSSPLSALCFQLCSLDMLQLGVITPEEAVVIDPRIGATEYKDKCQMLMKHSENNQDQQSTDNRLISCIMELGDAHSDDDDEEPQTKRQKLAQDHVSSQQSTRNAVRVMSLMSKDKYYGDKKSLISISNRFFVVNSSKVFIENIAAGDLLKSIKKMDSSKLLDNIRKDAFIDSEPITDKINEILDQKENELKECYNYVSSTEIFGATGPDVKTNCPGNVGNNLKKLTDLGLVVKVGIHDVRYVVRDCCDPWIVKSVKLTKTQRERMKPPTIASINLPAEDGDQNPAMVGLSSKGKRFSHIEKDIEELAANINDNNPQIKILLRPWIRVDGSINRKVLDFMLSSVLSYIMMKPGLYMTELAKRFHPALTYVAVYDLVCALVKLKCVTVRSCVLKQKTSLFTSALFEISDAEQFDKDEKMFIEASIDALLKLGIFIGHKNYSKDFLQ